MNPGSHFRHKLERVFSDGPKLIAEPGIFTKQTY